MGLDHSPSPHASTWVWPPSTLHVDVINGWPLRYSGNFYSASSSPLLLRSARILFQSFMPKFHKQLRMKDLPKVPTWWLELDFTRDPSDKRRQIYQCATMPQIFVTALWWLKNRVSNLKEWVLIENQMTLVAEQDEHNFVMWKFQNLAEKMLIQQLHILNLQNYLGLACAIVC